MCQNFICILACQDPALHQAFFISDTTSVIFLLTELLRMFTCKVHQPDAYRSTLIRERKTIRMDNFITFIKEEQGATAIEYAIMASAIAAVIASIVFIVGLKVLDLFEQTNTEMTDF
jgi:Flp pilus assembly pilin Flp